ncbi:TPA: hypothetical protein ACGEYH_001574 [Providencia rettgeri]|uniref:hypothetical protein n=1 Tax=unclassified Providencia TaxID=2633465 RepID=UPI00234A4EAC|nr:MULTISPECIES: hypothetical protein [unclassified Providencia]WOB99319.1 hypothetical protein P3L55_18985 [Providencia sp. PROV046]
MNQVNLITTCTNGKHGMNGNSLNLNGFSSGKISPELLIQSWCDAIQVSLLDFETIRVENLYKGGHWSTAKTIKKDLLAELWVLSAGFGLLHSDDYVLPYKATFSSGYSESIPYYNQFYIGKGFHKTWWNEISKRSPFQNEHPTSISSLMKLKPKEYFIICGSPDYINAIDVDVFNGLQYLESPRKQLVIITSKPVYSRLSSYQLKSDARISQLLKCNMIMLNICLAKYFLNEFIKGSYEDFGLLLDKLKIKFALLPKNKSREINKVTEEEVNKYINSILKENSKMSATQALRMFRSSGYSYEEKKFRNLFYEILNGND